MVRCRVRHLKGDGMEIQTLKLHLTDADLAVVVTKLAASAEGVEDLKARFSPEGVIVTGRYPTSFLTVSFETTWSVEAAGPELIVRLAALKVMGMPGGFLRGILLKMAKDALADEPGLRVEDDAIIIAVAEVAKAQKIDLKVHFTRVVLSVGTAVLEAEPGP